MASTLTVSPSHLSSYSCTDSLSSSNIFEHASIVVIGPLASGDGSGSDGLLRPTRACNRRSARVSTDWEGESLAQGSTGYCEFSDSLVGSAFRLEGERVGRVIIWPGDSHCWMRAWREKMAGRLPVRCRLTHEPGIRASLAPRGSPVLAHSSLGLLCLVRDLETRRHRVRRVDCGRRIYVRRSVGHNVDDNLRRRTNCGMHRSDCSGLGSERAVSICPRPVSQGDSTPSRSSGRLGSR